jgi:transposase-like protein
MTKAKLKSEFHKGTAILVDKLMQHLPAMPTQEDLFGPEGVVKQLSAALIERCLQAELSTHLGYEKNQRGQEARPNHRNPTGCVYDFPRPRKRHDFPTS